MSSAIIDAAAKLPHDVRQLIQMVLVGQADIKADIASIKADIKKLSDQQALFNTEINTGLMRLSSTSKPKSTSVKSQNLTQSAYNQLPTELKQYVSYFVKRCVEDAAFADKFVKAGSPIDLEISKNPEYSTMHGSVEDRARKKFTICATMYRFYFDTFIKMKESGQTLNPAMTEVVDNWTNFMAEYNAEVTKAIAASKPAEIPPIVITAPVVAPPIVAAPVVAAPPVVLIPTPIPASK